MFWAKALLFSILLYPILDVGVTDNQVITGLWSKKILFGGGSKFKVQNDQEPRTNDQEPMTRNQEPGTNDQEPSVSFPLFRALKRRFKGSRQRYNTEPLDSLNI
jgi:hypothetical protein